PDTGDLLEAEQPTEEEETTEATLPTPSAIDGASADPDQASIDRCREQVENHMADRSILFSSGSARLAPESEYDLAALAEVLAICPSTPVYVEGHTDADGGAEV